MGTIAQDLALAAANKTAIKAAINAKNPATAPTDVMSQWPTAIASIPTGAPENDGKLYFDGVEVEGVRYIPNPDTGLREYQGKETVTRVSGGLTDVSAEYCFRGFSNLNTIDLPYLRFVGSQGFRNIRSNSRIAFNLPSLVSAGQDCFYENQIDGVTLSLPSLQYGYYWFVENLALTELNVPNLKWFGLYNNAFDGFPNESVSQCLVKLTNSTYDPTIAPWNSLPWNGRTTIKFEFANCYVQYIDGAWTQVAKE